MDEVVSVTGTGTASAAPDVVALTVSVTCDGADVGAALRSAAARSAGVAAAARERGVEGRDLRSTGSAVHPVHTDSGVSVAAYRAWSQTQVTVRDLALVGSLVEAFVDAAGDALSVDRIALAVDDPSALERQARAAAYRDAHARATQLADLAGRALGRVLSVSDAGTAVPVGAPGDWAAASRYSVAETAAVEPGETTVRAVVSVRWAFGPHA